MRFERLIHIVSANFAPRKFSFVRHYTILCAHWSKIRACVRLKRLRMRDEDLTAVCDRTKKKKTKPEFQLGRFPWKARVKKERIDLFTVLFKCAPRGLFIETFIMEKVTCWYHTDHNPNSGVLPTDKYCVTAFDKSGLNNNTTHTKLACMCKDFEFRSWCFEIQA